MFSCATQEIYMSSLIYLHITYLPIHFVKISEIKIIASRRLLALFGISYDAIAMNFITIVNEIIF